MPDDCQQSPLRKKDILGKCIYLTRFHPCYRYTILVQVALPSNVRSLQYVDIYLFVLQTRDTCRMSRIVSSQDQDSERSPRFKALLSKRGGPFRLLFPLTCPPASTSPGEGLPDGLLEGSYGRPKRRSMRNRPNVDKFMPASEYETLIGRWCGKKLRLYMR